MRNPTCIRALAATLFCLTACAAFTADMPIELPAADGSLKRPFESLAKSAANSAQVARDTKAVVLIFYLHDCPICNAYASEIERIKAAYEPKGFSFFIVQTDGALTAAAALQHADAYHLTSPVLLDRENRLARWSGATVTPEVAVVGASAAPGSETGVLYLGRIDDLYADYGRRRPEATTRDLRVALDAIAKGKSPPPATGTAVGCYIPLGKRDESRK